MTQWLVLPSPFLGPAAYAPFVEALRTGGDDASVATYAGPAAAGSIVEEWAATASDLSNAVLVPHSNAGHLAPLVSDRCGRIPVVFMDAALPAPAGASALVPAGLRAHLTDLADDGGMLPAWTRWWPREDLDEVLPGDWFDRIDAISPRIPLTYIEESVDLPRCWEQGPYGYLAFGWTYAEEVTRAGMLGWPVEVLAPARHAHFLISPQQVACAVRDLADQLAQFCR